MSHLAIAKPPQHRHAGQALVATLGVATLLGIVAAIGLQVAEGSNSGAAKEGRTDLALQVADAAVNLYISRMQSDEGYYGHFTDPAEDPRVLADGSTVAPGSATTAGDTWTYPAGQPQNFTQTIQNARFGAATYNVRITPPTGAQPLTILATGKVGKEMRSVQAQIAPGSIADFQMVSDQYIAYGRPATTDGKIYSNAGIGFYGHALEQIFARDQVADCSRCDRGFFDKDSTPNFDSQFPDPIDFSRFTRSTLDVKQAAQAGGVYLNGAGVRGWLLQFLANGTFKAWPISGGVDLAKRMGTLGAPQTYPVPGNGAIYSEQDVVVSDASGTRDALGGGGQRDSVVRGAATVVSANNLYIGGNIAYSQPAPPRSDVLGMVATNNLNIAEYTPHDLLLYGATISQAGRTESSPTSPNHTHGTLTEYMSTATKRGGQNEMFTTRVYHWDPGLATLSPPYWPRVGAWLTKYWREVETPK